MNAGHIDYSVQGGSYVLRLSGAIRYPLAYSLNCFLTQTFAGGTCEDVVIDLRPTTAIDSTNLGLLAKIANYLRRERGRTATLISTNPEINELLAGVGFDRVFNICSTGATAEASCSLAEAEADEAALGETILEAHLVLSALNPRNAAEFHDVIEALRKPAASS